MQSGAHHGLGSAVLSVFQVDVRMLQSPRPISNFFSPDEDGTKMDFDRRKNKK
jgi:hypothetical protein